MNILALKMEVTEESVNQILAEYTPKDVPVEKFAVHITPEGILATGEYPTVFMRVSFKTLWNVAVSAGNLLVKLVDIQVSGVPATMLRGMLFKMLKEQIAQEPGLSIAEETLHIDVQAFLEAKGLPCRLNLRDIVYSEGRLLLIAGEDAPTAA